LGTGLARDPLIKDAAARSGPAATRPAAEYCSPGSALSLEILWVSLVGHLAVPRRKPLTAAGYGPTTSGIGALLAWRAVPSCGIDRRIAAFPELAADAAPTRGPQCALLEEPPTPGDSAPRARDRHPGAGTSQSLPRLDSPARCARVPIVAGRERKQARSRTPGSLNCITHMQSDEITLTWHAPDSKSQIWFDGRVHKMVSQLAAHATLHFYLVIAQRLPEYTQRLPTRNCNLYRRCMRREPIRRCGWNAAQSLPWSCRPSPRSRIVKP
jgi:hypothetical protein